MEKSKLEYDADFSSSADTASDADTPSPSGTGTSSSTGADSGSDASSSAGAASGGDARTSSDADKKLISLSLGDFWHFFRLAALCILINLLSFLSVLPSVLERKLTSGEYLIFSGFFFVVLIPVSMLAGLSVIGLATQLKGYPSSPLDYKFWAKPVLIEWVILFFPSLFLLEATSELVGGLVSLAFLVLWGTLIWLGVRKSNRKILKESGYTEFKTFLFTLGLISFTLHGMSNYILEYFYPEWGEW